MQIKTNDLTVLGTKLERMTRDDIKKRICELLRSGFTSSIFTPNSEMMVRKTIDPYFSSILSSADLLIPDGFGIYAASLLLSSPLPNRSTGIEFGEFIIEYASKNSLCLFLLGGTSGTADSAAKKIREKYPNLIIAGTHHGYFDHTKSSSENLEILKLINNSNADIVFVCLGSPAQEKWIHENKNYLPKVSLLVGLGGSLDVWSDKKKRAPRLFSLIGLEWLYRLLCDPSRIKRLPSLFAFPALVLKERLNINRSSNKRRKKRIGTKN